MAFIEDKSFVLQKHLPRGFETGKLKFWEQNLNENMDCHQLYRNVKPFLY